ncbi:hypothetical protein FHW58_004218 [Duganella sp. 1224]|uniref:LytR C-terminal domain-containing protein n=1 Tax=Duganella sp. 1224 TaxID=2587052 RepID=UPI0015C9FBF8|nr:LytR C-terminal domain-containing protein [Duganella sp. 1224]NYE62996.1 hypothetical protein [Duganella sp. 1224]
MMKKTWITSCALLAACGSTELAEPVADTITPLEQACLRDPLDPERWEQLAAALALAGQRERAATMYLQAASLRAHDVRQDYTTLKQARDEALDDSMPRTRVRRLGPALVEVVRADAPFAAQARTAPRLEISNGNGVRGAAARLARALRSDGVTMVRLSNLRPFVVPVSRIEYAPEQQRLAQTLGLRLGLQLRQRATGAAPAYADVRIVLGHDKRDLK